MIYRSIFLSNLLVLELSTLIIIHQLGLGSLILLLMLCIPPLLPLTSLLLENASLRIPLASLCPMITKEKRFLLQVGVRCLLVRTISLFCSPSEAVMACQPDRAKFPFFVCNENVIQFFILSRTSVGFALDEFTPLKWLSDGRDYLYRLITASDNQLFWTLPQVLVDGNLVPLTGFLGAGAHATVYSCKFENLDCVLKIFRAGTEGNLSTLISLALYLLFSCTISFLLSCSLFQIRSRPNCGFLIVLRRFVVVLYFMRNLMMVKHWFCRQLASDSVSRPKFLSLFQKLCVLAVPCRKQHISAIIDIVKDIHDLEVVHRDLKIGNIFAVPDPVCAAVASSETSFVQNHVLINDLGCATDLNSSASFAGTLHFASDEALIAATKNATKVWKRADDLVSILKFAFILFNNSSTFSEMKQAISPASVLQFWQNHLPAAWVSVVELAKTVDSDSSLSSYNAFKDALLNLLWWTD